MHIYTWNRIGLNTLANSYKTKPAVRAEPEVHIADLRLL